MIEALGTTVESTPEAHPRWPRALRALAVIAVAAVLGCGDQSGPGAEGTVRLTLLSPNGNEGAALFELPDGVLSVRAPVGTVLESQIDGKRFVALFVNSPRQLVLDITLADAREIPDVQLRQVSGPSDQLRSLVGYRVHMAPR